MTGSAPGGRGDEGEWVGIKSPPHKGGHLECGERGEAWCHA